MNSDALGSTFWVGKQGAPFWYEMASEGFLPEETRVFGSRVPNFPYTGRLLSTKNVRSLQVIPSKAKIDFLALGRVKPALRRKGQDETWISHEDRDFLR